MRDRARSETAEAEADPRGERGCELRVERGGAPCWRILVERGGATRLPRRGGVGLGVGVDFGVGVGVITLTVADVVDNGASGGGVGGARHVFAVGGVG